MELYKNGTCVFSVNDAYVDIIADYIKENYEDMGLRFIRPWKYIRHEMKSTGCSLGYLVDLNSDILNATEDDYIITVGCTPYLYTFEMQESDSKEAVDVWLSILSEVDFEATWKIELDEQ